MMPPQFGKRSRKGYVYHHPAYDDLDKDDGLIIGGLLLGIWGLYWLLVHWVDHFLGNHMVWWVEPLTLLVTMPIMGFFVMVVDRYGANPLYWWPMFWGTKIMIDRETDFYMAFDPEQFVQNNGGKYNVFCSTDSNEDLYVKFRLCRDAVVYSLRNI